MGCSCSQATEPEPQKPNTVKKPPPRVNDTIMDLEDTERVLGKLFKNPDKDSSDIDFPRFASHITFYNSLGEEISQPPLEERKHAKILRSLHMLFSLLEPSRHDKIMESAEKEAEGIAFNEKANFSKFIEDVLVKGCPVHLVMKVMTQVHMCPFVGAIVGATFPPYMVKDAGKWTISIQIPTQLTTKEAETINQNEEADISPNQPMSDTNPIQEQAEEDINPSQTPVADHSAPQPSSLSHLDITKPLIVVHHKNQSTLPAFCEWEMEFSSIFKIVIPSQMTAEERDTLLMPFYPKSDDFQYGLAFQSIKSRFHSFNFIPSATTEQKENFLKKLLVPTDEISKIIGER